jgi:hypothetical protein
MLVDLRLGREDGSTWNSGGPHLRVRLWWSWYAMSWLRSDGFNLLYCFSMSFRQLISFNNGKCRNISGGFDDGTYGWP